MGASRNVVGCFRKLLRGLSPAQRKIQSFPFFCSTTPLLYHTDLRTEAHVPTPWYDQYLTVRAHNHVTLVVAARDSRFVLISIYQAASEMFYLLLSTPSVTSLEG